MGSFRWFGDGGQESPETAAEGAIRYKARRAGWHAVQHPRDHNGQFVETGAAVRLTGGLRGTFQGVDQRTGRIRVRRADGSERLYGHSQVTYLPAKPDPGGGVSQPAAFVPSGPDLGPLLPARGDETPAARPMEHKTPKAKIFREPGQDPKARTSMPESMRTSISDLNIDTTFGYSGDAQDGAAAIRNNLPLTAAQASALATAVGAYADSPGIPGPRKRSLKNGVERLDVVAAQLGGFNESSIPDKSKSSLIDSGDVRPGDVIALPNRGGGADVRKVTAEIVPWYNEYKYTMVDGDGKSETRRVAPGTPVYRFDSAASVDEALGKGGNGGTGQARRVPDPAAAAKPKKPAPFVFTGSGSWFDQMAVLGDNSEPFPVTDLTIERYKITNGLAWRHHGRSYLVELKPGDSPLAAKTRMEKSIDLLESSLSVVPEDKAILQRGMALLEGRNPADAQWAKTYNMPGFKSAATAGGGGTTAWGGHVPTTGTLTHEFGHNVDSQLYGTSQWFSRAAVPTLPGQTKTWSSAMSDDAAISSFYKGRFTEVRGEDRQHGILLGDSGITDYGKTAIVEDYAESVRLWMRDRRLGKIGKDQVTGDDLRFSDVFPQRAKNLDASFGTVTDAETFVRALRRKDAENVVFADLEKVKGVTFNSDLTELDVVRASGLPHAEVPKAWARAKERYAKIRADQAAEAAAGEELLRVTRAQVEAAAQAAGVVASVQEALESGRLPKVDASNIRSRTYAYKRRLRARGVPPMEVERLGLVFEAQAIMDRFKLDGASAA